MNQLSLWWYHAFENPHSANDSHNESHQSGITVVRDFGVASAWVLLYVVCVPVSLLAVEGATTSLFVAKGATGRLVQSLLCKARVMTQSPVMMLSSEVNLK
jgi:hypothetical protein